MDGIMSSKLFTTRQGTIFLGLIAAVIAAVALIVYLNQYRNSVNNTALTRVLVAGPLIQQGTPGRVIAGGGGSGRLFQWEKFSKPDAGALVDPATLTGQVALRDIYPGQQLTAEDFGPATTSLIQQLGPKERAVAVPLGTAQQVDSQVAAGSHVDVWEAQCTAVSGNHPIAVLIAQDLYVLRTNGGNATVRTTARQAGLIIWGSENCDLWLALRPTVATNLNQTPVIGG